MDRDRFTYFVSLNEPFLEYMRIEFCDNGSAIVCFEIEIQPPLENEVGSSDPEPDNDHPDYAANPPPLESSPAYLNSLPRSSNKNSSISLSLSFVYCGIEGENKDDFANQKFLENCQPILQNFQYNFLQKFGGRMDFFNLSDNLQSINLYFLKFYNFEFCQFFLILLKTFFFVMFFSNP
ncbi:hypothetical protein Mgra_00007720 [Meloidogyne graminicola]|uniref:Uncharacterized protein n=1 Tax=Meloidogyne graminicola TaxID=189291 RepID=A0A8S9ZHN7_9BILA|nr:hypothetical protein Mgra_00007720 [Meloidogyne graminicola]